jgi:tetratricopeptide (TPR) repeat protein
MNKSFLKFESGSDRFKAVAVFVFLILSVSYSNAFHHGFLLDDHQYFFKEDIGLMPYQVIFSWSYEGFYRPIPVALLKIVRSLSQDNPVGYHAYNLFLFYVICLLFYLIILRIFNDFPIAALTVCLYAAHPIQNFLVNYKTANFISIYIILMQFSTWYFLKWVDGKKGKFYALSLAGYFLSLFSHEIAFMLPLYFFLVLYWGRPKDVRPHFSWVAPYLFLFGLFLILRQAVHNLRPLGAGFNTGITFPQAVASLFELVRWYLSRLIFPVNILFVWDVMIVKQALFWRNLAFWSGLAAVGFLIYFKRKDQLIPFSIMLAAMGLFPLCLAAFMYTTTTETAVIEPHWFYFTSIGFFLLTAKGLLALSVPRHRPLGLLIAVLIILTLSFTTRMGNKHWRDERSYCKYWLSLNPLNAVTWEGLAETYDLTAERAELLAELKNVFSQVQQVNYKILYDVAFNYQKLGEYGQAISLLSQSLELNPGYIISYYGRGICYIAIQRYPWAIKDFTEAIELYEQRYQNQKPAFNFISQIGKILLPNREGVSNVRDQRVYCHAHYLRAKLYEGKKDIQAAYQDALKARPRGPADTEIYIQHLEGRLIEQELQKSDSSPGRGDAPITIPNIFWNETKKIQP